MTTQRIIDALPAVYKVLLPRFFESEIPRETAATCADCAMSAAPEGMAMFRVAFSRESKCCTHYPNLPNYLVGALLSDTGQKSEAGRRRVREAIHSGVGVSPRGVRRPRKFDLLMRSSERGFFGRSASLICPFFERERGICTVRPFWDAVCNTWFCKYSLGQEGMSFWLAVRRYLLWAEETLIRYSLRELGWRAEEIIRQGEDKGPLSVGELDQSPLDKETYRALWGDWAGREEEFFRECYGLVAALSHSRFERLAGVTQAILLDDVRERRRGLMRPRLPKVLLRNPELRQEKVGDDAYILIGYSPLDPFQVTKRVYDLLDFFDGTRTHGEVRQSIREAMGAEPDEELIEALYRFRILVPGEQRTKGAAASNP